MEDLGATTVVRPERFRSHFVGPARPSALRTMPWSRRPRHDGNTFAL
jgi:hypothetical protein